MSASLRTWESGSSSSSFAGAGWLHGWPELNWHHRYNPRDLQRRVCMQVGACCVSDLAFLLKGLSFSRSEGPRMANVTHMGLCSSAESVPG